MLSSIKLEQGQVLVSFKHAIIKPTPNQPLVKPRVRMLLTDTWLQFTQNTM